MLLLRSFLKTFILSRVFHVGSFIVYTQRAVETKQSTNLKDFSRGEVEFHIRQCFGAVGWDTHILRVFCFVLNIVDTRYGVTLKLVAAFRRSLFHT